MNKYYYDYLRLLVNKPHSKEIQKAMDRMPYYENHFKYNNEFVDSIINFIEGMIYLQKGGEGKKFKLLTEQKFWISLLGYEDENDVPVITELPVILGAGSGKTTLMAALALALEMIGSNHGNDILILANTTEQAQELFRAASSMVKDEKSTLNKLRKAKLLNPNRNEIIYDLTTSSIKIKAMDNDSIDGTNLRAAIYDEFHAFKTDVIQNVRKSSLPKRIMNTGFISIYISTNGTTRGSVFDTYYERFQKILNGELEDYTSFPLIYKLDDISEVYDMNAYEKAMPFIRDISDPKVIYQNVVNSKGNPVAQSEILAKSFNIPQQEYNAYFTADKIRASFELEVTPDDRAVYVGFDMASVNDLSSVAFVRKAGIGFDVVTHSFIPREGYEEAPREKRSIYNRFIDRDELTLIDKPTIDQEDVFDWIMEYLSANGLTPVGFGSDAYYSKQLRNLIIEEFGKEMMYTVRPNVMNTSEPLKNIKALIDAGDAAINEELMAWSLGNVRVKLDGAGNVYANKAKAVDKIDPVWALINAYWLIINAEQETFGW